MIDSELMCMQHILGEHRELHALVGTIKRTRPEYEGSIRHKNNLIGLARDGFIELKSLKKRHDELAKHFENHNSPIKELPPLKYLPKKVREARVDREKAVKDLIDRPKSCRPEGGCRDKILG
ncbi:hypothetical protein [Methanonatronarchaeum sp. AMET-Sl]|uniref:hypothetical protein n=1 Tax=Methanonatronarchaeum sp. AMET-Sl TaxID=3037654 RepID=UPI00244DDB3E|nr:hypothetical protein [Methanonatronarchaeum sp. AMET-Sl]WGI18015.1 hypothetical protein QEN48_03155 [Methanonatronarchaeum sp. AMET-Sl]